MSITPWWKKEISLRRPPRATAVVAKPMMSAELVERAAGIFDLEQPVATEPSIWPTEPPHEDVLAPPPVPVLLPPVWPPALVESPTLAGSAAVGLERVPNPAPEPEPEPMLPAAAELEPEPAVSLPPLVFPALAPVEEHPDPVSDPEPNVTPLFPEPKPELQQEEETAAEPAPPAAVTPPAKKPLLKRELRLPRPRTGRKANDPNAPRASRRKNTRPRQSIWERNLSLPRLRRPDAPVKLLGLRVGSTQLAAAHVSNNGSIELLQLARSPLRPGVVVGGEVREPDALAAELKTFFAQNKLPRKNIRLGVASNRIGVRALELPVIDDPRAFANSIRFRAQELLPIPVTDAVLDHVVIGEYVSDDGSAMCRVLLAFAHRDLVARYATACQKAGLKLAGIDLDAFALLRSLSEPRAESAEATQAVVAIAIGHERTVFAVSDGLICDFVRVLEWGGGALDTALAHSLDLSLEGAHEAKHQLALLDGSGAAPDGLAPVQVEAARATVLDELRVLSQELVSSLRYYQTRAGSLAIGEILVTGGCSELPGLVEELERLVGVPVRTADPLLRVKLGKKVKRPAEAGSFAVAIGLGIDS